MLTIENNGIFYPLLFFSILNDDLNVKTEKQVHAGIEMNMIEQPHNVR